MKIAILGTGMVGQNLARKLAANGHSVRMGTRDPTATLARTEPGNSGNPSFSEWHQANPDVKVVRFADVAKDVDLVINALSGAATMDGLAAVGADTLAGKILIDIANPLDFSKGFPPSLSVANTESLGEHVQAAYPDAKVVKTLNTVNTYLMTEPGNLADGDHSMCVGGNDAEAKRWVTEFLKTEFGWKDVIDLGDITTARGTEAFLLWWIRLMGSIGHPDFGIKIVR